MGAIFESVITALIKKMIPHFPTPLTKTMKDSTSIPEEISGYYSDEVRARPGQTPGLLALSLGLSVNFADDHAMLEAGMLMYDAFYAWCRSAQGQTHDWNPAAMGMAR